MLGEGRIIDEATARELDQVIDRYRGQPSGLIQVLHRAQEIVGYVPREVQERVAEGLDVPLSDVYGVVSFYALFSLKPKGKYKISVCAGTACYVRGTVQVLEALEKELGVKPGETTDDGKFSVEVVRCLGACGLGPVMMINEDVHGRLDPGQIPGILACYG
ncbi:MAG: NADH-quinone oxidoreductase subunit NuoE [Firmicutes bacterium]|nr:NADH-quinone oxidoreductase subunit NuoE [Bacillota bacterium]